MQELGWRRGKFGILVFLCQVAFIIIFGCLVDYGWDATPVSRRPAMFRDDHAEQQQRNNPNSTGPAVTSDVHLGREKFLVTKTSVESFYAMFQDIHVMIFVGFGFLMTFLKKYGYSAIGMNFLMAAFVLQWSSIVRGFYRLPENNWRIRIDLVSLVCADFTAGTVLITLGVVLGKLSPIQYIVMLMFETVLITVNEWIGYDMFFIKDVGGSITIHLFGGFFGLALARTIHRKQYSDAEFNNLKEGSTLNDLFSLIGTMFLWLFWPSFNACTAVEDGRYRAIYNTYFSIAASVLGAYMVSSFVKHEKFALDIVQNATLAGGVVVGSVCDMYLYPYGALICGFFIGIISALGFNYLSPILDRKLGIHDTCGVNNLHVIPSFVGGILSAIVTACASKELYGSGYYTQFPAHVPPADSAEYAALHAVNPDLKPGLGWTPSVQAGYQLAAMAVTIGIAIGGGIITGLVLRLPIWNTPNANEVFNDGIYWEMPAKFSKEEEAALRDRLDRQERGLPEKEHYTTAAAHGMTRVDVVNGKRLSVVDKHHEHLA
ncbi:ammonium transporter Rh type A-like [Paramacrobiotus metropolitanus]|uniref:ammonium transporter Rh type A-like n=1 Tax=Paramacrobiotus metropolitanus TaxID=2943436 RepID=UPI002445FF96|nr:ammonium transporter Rh type A-like [Paramacrobiotus metropolitanus]